MNKLPFVLWMLLFPLIGVIERHLDNQDYSEDAKGYYAYYRLIMYFGIAGLLWNNS